jgi:hypothetical protein
LKIAAFADCPTSFINGAITMSRKLILFTAVAAMSLVALSHDRAQAATETGRADLYRSTATPDDAAKNPPPGPGNSGNDIGPELTPQEFQVSQIAGQHGDRGFLMVDKALGRIIIFNDGRPVLVGPALTGASPYDRFAPGILSKPDSYKFSKMEKVTPAGRFTVTRSPDDELGTSFEINEVHGKDWWIAIHRVYLGIPSEHRQERIQSGNPQEEHVTFGCINVGPEAMRYLTTHLPKKGKTPLYVLPLDNSQTSTFFPSRASVTPVSSRSM